MANFDGCKPFEITRFSSVVEKVDPTALPLGVLSQGRNVKFRLGSVRTRDGVQSQYGFVLPDKAPVTGLIAQKVGQENADDLQVPIALSALGNLYAESPAGSGIVVQISGPLVDLRKPIAFSDSFLAPRALPLGPNYVFDPANGYIFGAQGLQQPLPGVSPAWNTILAGPAQGDQNATAAIPTFNAGISNFSVGLLLRYLGTPGVPISYYAAGLSASNPQISIYKYINGVVTVLVSSPALAVPDNSTFVFSVVGATLTATLNGVVVATIVDPDLTTGTTGFITTGPPISNFSSTAYSSDAVSMQSAAAFKRGYFAFTDLKHAYAPPAVYNPLLGKLDPLSMKQVGQLWTPDTFYQVGEVITPAAYVKGAASGYPVDGNGHSYRCTVPGKSGTVQPVFPVTEVGTVTEAGSTLTWQENTPLMAQAIPSPVIPVVTINAGAGTFPVNRDIYIATTYVNGLGETAPGPYFLYGPSVLNDQLSVASPPIPTNWIGALLNPYAIIGYNVYEADVVHGAAIPAFASFKKVNGGAVLIGTPTLVNAAAVGVAPPTVNSALIVPAGNICSGLRYMVVLFVNRNGYITGMTVGSVASYNGPSPGYKLFTAYIPVGPENTVARICAFTPAGQLGVLAGYGVSNVGPYFWIPPSFANGIFDLAAVPAGVTIAEVLNGIPMTSTLINDNLTTSAVFNFTDDYLKSQVLNDVSSFFRKRQVPPCQDIYYAKSIRRMFYATDDLPSGWRVSLPGDPESIYGDSTAIVQAAENNGQNRTAIREFSGVIYPMKEESGHVLTPNANDPSKWDVKEQWTGSGPCGPRAVDVCGSFMCYAHRSAPYIFKGGVPYGLLELSETWRMINWSVAQTIWVTIDDEWKEIHIGVPLNDSLVPSHIIKINYEENLLLDSQPIYFSHFSGKWVANPASYKFSVDDIAANLAIRAKRTLQTITPSPVDGQMLQSQLLFASSNADGVVAAPTPFVYDDNGQGIDSYIETAAISAQLVLLQIGGVQLNIDGQGKGTVSLLGARSQDPKSGGVPPAGGPPEAHAGTELLLKKEWEAGVPYACGGRMTNEQIRLRVSNEKRKGVGFDLKWACIFAQPVGTARPG